MLATFALIVQLTFLDNTKYDPPSVHFSSEKSCKVVETNIDNTLSQSDLKDYRVRCYEVVPPLSW